MAVTHNFRSAIGGFHREDVVRYIEYMNTKHASHVNQLTNEAESLRSKLKELESVLAKEDRTPQLEAQVQQLQAQLTEANYAKAALEEASKLHQEALAAAEAQIAQLKEKMEHMAIDMQARELDAYRRAERTERLAQERADRIYQQAAGTLAEATTQVDTAADLFRQIADRVNSQMEELQSAVERSKDALQDAAATMYSIHTEE
jgi:chromosome segregation ATPase